MTINVFLIDNSASMATKMVNGITYMDFARQFVEQFMKMRAKDPISKADRYMLMCFDEYPLNVKAGWRENQGILNEAMRTLKTTGESCFLEAFNNAVRYINLNRVHTGIENYGYGRFPTFTEPVNFFCIIDYNSLHRPLDELHTDPLPKLPLAELTNEFFRWDHRLYVIALDVPGHSNLPDLTFEYDEDEEMAEKELAKVQKEVDDLVNKMNGKLFKLTNPKNLTSILEYIMNKIQVNGVFIRWDKQGNDPSLPKNPVPEAEKEDTEKDKILTLMENGDADELKIEKQPAFEEEDESTEWRSSTALLFRNPKTPFNAQSSWPIPEDYWPEQSLQQVPTRKVYPEIKFRCETDCEQVSTPGFPFDKYELENGPLAKFILSRRDPKSCWQLFVQNSHRQRGMGYPFGYLKAASNLQSVNVFIFPYNYPLLFAIIEEAQDDKLRLTEQFRAKVQKYFDNIPSYYVTPLRKALKKYPIQHQLLEDNYANHFLHYSVTQSFSKAKQLGKEEFEKVGSEVSKQDRKPYLLGAIPLAIVSRSLPPDTLRQRRIALLQHYKSQIVPAYKDTTLAISTIKMLKDSAQRFQNPYLIERTDMLDHLERMKVNLDQHLENSPIPVLEGGLPGQRIRLQHVEDLHAQPIVKMGEFVVYQKKLIEVGRAPLREFEPQQKPHAFGNPFKLDKKSMAVDEVIDETPETAQPNGNVPATNGKKDDNNRKRASSEPPNGTPSIVPRKRKVGPLDRAAILRWRQRLSNASNDWETSSIVSDPGYTNDDIMAEPPTKTPRYTASEPGDLSERTEELIIIDDDDEGGYQISDSEDVRYSIDEEENDKPPTIKENDDNDLLKEIIENGQKRTNDVSEEPITKRARIHKEPHKKNDTDSSSSQASVIIIDDEPSSQKSDYNTVDMEMSSQSTNNSLNDDGEHSETSQNGVNHNDDTFADDLEDIDVDSVKILPTTYKGRNKARESKYESYQEEKKRLKRDKKKDNNKRKQKRHQNVILSDDDDSDSEPPGEVETSSSSSDEEGTIETEVSSKYDELEKLEENGDDEDDTSISDESEEEIAKESSKSEESEFSTDSDD